MTNDDAQAVPEYQIQYQQHQGEEQINYDEYKHRTVTYELKLSLFIYCNICKLQFAKEMNYRKVLGFRSDYQTLLVVSDLCFYTVTVYFKLF